MKKQIKKIITTIFASLSLSMIIPIILSSCTVSSIQNSSPNSPGEGDSHGPNKPLITPPNKPNEKPPITLPDKPNEKPTDKPTNKPFENYDDSYLENNLANPITNGSSVFFSTPGGGFNNYSINTSNGQNKTQPSENVPHKAELDNMLRNSIDQHLAKITYSMAFSDKNGSAHLGTGWILDFKLPGDNENYPKTWYIATNTHVIQNLKVKNDIITPERFNNNQYSYANTGRVILRIMKKFDLNTDVGNTMNDDFFEIEEIYPENDDGSMNLKTVFVGNDFLKTSPSMFSNSGKWNGIEEYADFAVMEVSFKDEDTAKRMTNNYYNDSALHFKYKKESLLKKPENINNNTFNVLGYPALTKDSFETRGTLATNKPKNLDGENANFRNGGKLASTKYYNTYEDRVGMFDAAIGLSFFTFPYRISDPNNVLIHEEKNYAIWGLIYASDYDNIHGGSSGSMMMDKNGYTWGIHYMIDDDASIGFSQALYSEGFNYQGKFGSYNLQGYDLIEGGFPNQKTSYKDGLKILYGNDPNFKTNLFKNGLSYL